MASFLVDGVQLPQRHSNFEEAFCFLQISSEGRKTELTLEPSSSFEHGTSRSSGWEFSVLTTNAPLNV